MVSIALFLSYLSVFTLQTNQLQDAHFSIERPQVSLSPSRHAILINQDGDPLVFRLTFHNPLPANARIKAELIGPSLATAISLDQPSDQKMIILPRSYFQQEGIYELTNVRIEVSGNVLAFASPQTAEIQVSQEFVVTEVSVSALTEKDLLELGYVFHPDDYVAVNFQLALSIETKPEQVNVTIPVVFPRHNNSSFKPQILHDPFSTFHISALIINSNDGPNGSLSPLFKPEPEHSKPTPLMGLLLIPGQLKYLRSHFAVTCVLLNAAPEGFSVKASNMLAELHLPPATSAGFPLTIQEPTRQVMVNMGRDGQPNTPDDSAAVTPGQKAQAKYVITGNTPGFHDFEVLIKGDLELPQGKDVFATRTKASVYVRNPDYALSFEHPDAVEADETYTLAVRVVNTGQIAMEGFQLVLDGDRLQGVRLADGEHPVREMGTIAIGAEAIATYQLRSQVTGKVVAGYVKINHASQNYDAVQLRVAVGDIGQRISPYTLNFDQSFFDQFPANLTDALRKYAKKALDTSMTADHELPQDLLPTSSSAVRSMNREFVRAAKGPSFGMTPQESLARLLRVWMHSGKGYEPLDHIRRKILNLQELPLETAFGSALASRFTGSAHDILTQISQENEDLAPLSLVIVDHSAAIDIRLSHPSGNMANSGTRDLPFGGMFPLSATRTLLWFSGEADLPELLLEPLGGNATATVAAVFGLEPGQRWYFGSSPLILDRQHRIEMQGANGLIEIFPKDRPSQANLAEPVSPKPFQLVSIAQVHKTAFGEADPLGRHHRLYFSAPVDLTSLYPLEEHLTLNGQPIVFGELQSDKRTLIVTSQMPLGPYHPIAYRLKDVKAKDGQLLALEEGTYTGSSSYTGVSVAGRVADRNGSDFSKAKAFLWYWDQVLDPEDPAFSGNSGELVPRIVQTETPNQEGRWYFDFVPTIPEPESADPFVFQTLKVGVLLEDGRYQEQTFRPQGAGQVIAAEFAFLQLGTVQGHVYSEGQPLPYTQVFVTSENNAQSAVLLETDANGFYKTDQIQVGQVLVKAAHENQVGLMGGYLTAYNSPLVIDLDIATPNAHLAGTVTQVINGLSTPMADVIVGYAAQGRTFNYIHFYQHQTSAKFVALTRTDSEGDYQLPNIPAGQGEVWFYHHDFGLIRRPMVVLENETAIADYQYQPDSPDLGTVTGRVEDVFGNPVEGAEVRQGNSITYTDTSGNFLLPHVPKNQAVLIRANLSGVGNGELGVFLEQDLLSGQTIVLHGSVPISGVYLNAYGNPVPFAPVYMSYLQQVSVDGYHYYSDYVYFGQTDFAGHWEGTGPKESVYRFSGFSPPETVYASNITVGPTGLTDVVLQKSGLGDLRVRVLDADGNPVVAKVNVKSMVPSAELETLGRPELLTTHQDIFTDVDGYVDFPNLSTGAFEVFAHSSSLGQTETHQGMLALTTQGNPQTVTLAFPPEEETANLFGTIYQPDGVTPAPDGTIVRLKGPGVNAYVIATLAGTYRFENLALNAEPVRLELVAYHPTTRHFYREWLDLNQDLNFRNDLILRKRMSVNVRVIHADGEPAEFAEVHADFLDTNHNPAVTNPEDLVGDDINTGFRRETSQVTPQDPVWMLDHIPSGPLVIKAVSGNGLAGMQRLELPLDRDSLDVTVRLETASQISGIFVDDLEAPLVQAPVALKQHGDYLHQILSGETPGNEGTFLFDSLPMGRYELEGVDPATARKAHLEVVTSPFRPAPNVVLKLDPVGEFTGLALFNGAPVPNTALVLRGKHFKVTTGTDATGRFKFANLPLGRYTIRGHASALPSRIHDEVDLVDANQTLEKNLAFGDVRDLEIQLLDPDGSGVANVLLSIYRGRSDIQFPIATSAYTDVNGQAILKNLPTGTYRLATERLTDANAVYEVLKIHDADTNPTSRTIQLAGTGILYGQVTDSLGQALDQPVQVRFAIQDPYGVYRHKTITTQEDGTYRLGNVLVDRRIEVTAYHPGTHEVDYAVLELDQHGQALEHNLSFLATTSVSGVVKFLDGSPAPFAEVSVVSPIRNETRANQYGEFHLSPVLEGDTVVFVVDPSSGRSAKMPITLSSSDGVLLDPLENLEITLGGVASLSGAFTFVEGDPVRFGTVTLADTGSNKRFEVRLQGDGSYLFQRLPLGTYTLSAYSDLYGVSTPDLSVTLGVDQAQVVQNHTFEPSYTLSGTVYAPNHTDPVPGATVTLWRQRTEHLRDGYELVYAATTDASGAYTIDRVFPGLYLQKASNPDFSASWVNATFSMPSAHTDLPIYLDLIIPLLGTLADASDRPFSSGSLTLVQDGAQTRLPLDHQGGFGIPNIRPTPYRLDYSLADGWIKGSLTVNQPTAAPVTLRTVDTVTLSGRAILAKNGDPAKPSVYLRKGNISRRVFLAADGSFSLSQVPVNEPITMELKYSRSSRIFDLGTFTQATNLGDHYLDFIKPSVSFAQDGATFTTLPLALDFQIAEDDPDSDIDPSQTAVWINDTPISSHFLTDQTSVSANFDLLPEGFLLGTNTLKIRVYNTSNTYQEKTYTFDLNLVGPTLVADLRLSGDATEGQLKVDEGDWMTVPATGRVIIHNLTVDHLRLKAKHLAFGVRKHVPLSQAATQFVTLKLQPVGHYHGSVLGPDGIAVPGIPITLNNSPDYEISDANGRFKFEYLPWDKHALWVQEPNAVGYVLGPDILNNEQTFLNVDIHLDGYGTLTGTVYDDDGVTPIPNAAIVVKYKDLPNYPQRNTTANGQGTYLLDNVLTSPIQITATEPGTLRTGRVDAQIAELGTTATVDVLLQPNAVISGVALNVDGQPADGAVVTVREVFGAVSFEGLTDSLGQFTLPNIPYGNYYVSIKHDSVFQYRKGQQFSIQQVSYNLGNLQLQTDMPPTDLEVIIPNPFHPAPHKFITVKAQDDRTVSRWVLTLSDAYSKTFSDDLTWPSLQHHIEHRIPSSTPAGNLHYVLEVWDHLNQRTELQGDVLLTSDTFGPEVTITEPLDQASFWEGQPITIEVEAYDPSSLWSVSVTLNGVEVGSETGYFDTDRDFHFTAIAPDVSVPTTMPLVAAVSDRKGNVTNITHQVEITPILTTGTPEVTVLAPLPNQPLPFWLPQGLELRFAAKAADPDGLGTFDILINGEWVSGGALAGSEDLLEATVLLPENLREAETLNVGMVVRDLGGIAFTTEYTLVKLPGTWLVKSALEPLTLPTWYQSPAGERSVILAGGEHTIDGIHQLDRLVLVNGATLTQSPSTWGDAYVAGTQLHLADMAMVDYGSQINVDGKGFNQLPISLGLGNGRASHGGLGEETTNLAQLYGSPFRPIHPGSHKGGGAVGLHTDTLWLLGNITASANQPTGRLGSGGSIWVSASSLFGEGLLSANGFAGVYSDSDYRGGGGGRIAMETPYALPAQAFGGKNAGAGTIYFNMPDAMEPDGYFRSLTIANHPLSTTTKKTRVRTQHNLVVGTDVDVLIDIIDNETRQVVQFLDPDPLPLGSYLGMRIFTAGNFASSTPVFHQTATNLQSDANEVFGTFSNGDILSIDYQLDALIVKDHGWFDFDTTQPSAVVQAHSGHLSSNSLTVNLGSLSIAEGESVDLRGTFNTDSLSVDGELTLDGDLVTGILSVGVTGTITTPSSVKNGRMGLTFTQGTIDGSLKARRNGLDVATSSGYERSHGGLGDWDNVTSYGSLYFPTTQGNSRQNDDGFGGGVIRLKFDTLAFSGTADVTPEVDGSGGSILVEGQTLSGNGSFIAHGGPINYRSGGGGRIAVLVNDISGYSGQSHVSGSSRYDLNYTYGGSGTVFFRTSQWPHGRLILDNQGNDAPTRSTPLPGIGQRTVTDATGGARLDDTNLPPFNSLVGLYVTVPGQDPVQIAGQDANGLIPTTSFPALAAGESYGGLHTLDILEVRNGAKLYAIDPIEITQQMIVDGGEIDAQVHLLTGDVLANGSGELSSNPGWTSLELDNYQLTVNFPMDIQQLTLRNGSSLTYKQPVQIGTVIVEAGSSLQSAVEGTGLGLEATNLTLQSGATWTVADRKPDKTAYPLRASVTGTLTVEPSATITTSGPVKVSQVEPVWAGQPRITMAHGGLPKLFENEDVLKISGSFAYPEWPGSSYGGGIIFLSAGQMILNGQILANGESTGTGGSVQIHASNLSGTGTISAKPKIFYKGGGRIAVHYGSDDSFRQTLTFITLPNESLFNNPPPLGAGTLFFKSQAQAHGDLVIDQQDIVSTNPEKNPIRFWLSGVTGLKEIELNLDDSDLDPLVIRDTSWTELPPGLAGLTLQATIAETTYRSKITSNTHDTLTLASPFPDSVPAGTVLSFILELDNLVLRNGGQLHFPGVIELNGDLVLEGTHFTSLYAEDLVGLPNPWNLSNKAFRLNLKNPNLGSLDVALNQATLFLDYPIAFRDLTLTDSWVEHSPWTTQAYETHLPNLDVALRHLVADADSGFNVEHRVKYREGTDGYGSPRPGGGSTYGSLFQPDEFGSGASAGGRMKIRAESITGGHFLAKGEYIHTGGSIWIDTQTLSGAIEVDAGLRDRVSGAGGRIAIYYSDASGATLSTEAHGTGAGGTIFIKDHQELLGNLSILGDNQPFKGSYATTIPHFAPQTLSAGFTTAFDAANQTTALMLPGLSSSTNWAGYHLVVNHDELNPVEILASASAAGTTTFTLRGDHTTLQSGDLLELAVVVNRFDMSAGTRLDLGDLLLIYDNDYPTDHVFQQGTAAFLDPPQTADGKLILDQFDMVLHAPGNYDHIELRNGSSLKIEIPGSADTAVLSGNTLTVTDGTLIADHLAFTGNVTVAAGGQIESYTNASEFQWPAGTPLQSAANAALSFGGMGESEIVNNAPIHNPTFGSFSQPWTTGQYRRSLKISAGNLHIDGVIAPDLDYESVEEGFGGGALWVEAAQLSGSGLMHVNVHHDAYLKYSGGGRIAVYYSDSSAWFGSIEAKANVNSGSPSLANIYRDRGAPGTIYLKSSDQSYGDLRITGTNYAAMEGTTAMVGLGRRTLTAQASVSGQTLTDLGQEFPYSLKDLFLVWESGGSTFESRILSNTPTTITVADPLPAMQPGDEITAKLHLDTLILEKSAQFYSPDEVVIHGDLQFGSRSQQPSTLWARALQLPTPTWTFNGVSGGLAVEETTNLTHLTLDNAEIWLDRPLTLTQLDLVNSTVLSHRPARSSGYRLYSAKPAVELQVDTINVDATSSISVVGKGYPNDPLIKVEEMWGISSNYGYGHGGNAHSMESGYAYGTPYQPESYGFRGGAGRIHLTANQLNLLGSLDASGTMGGSIWLEVGTLAGDGPIRANGGLPGGTAGSGGRIAIAFDDNQRTVLPEATSPVVNHGGTLVQYGAGTVYLYDRIADTGTLILRNTDQAFDTQLATPIHGVGTHTLAATPADPSVIQVPGANWRYSLAGHRLVDTTTGTTYRILSNTPDTLVLDQPINPAPSAGWAFHGEPSVDVLVVNQATLSSSDLLVDRTPPSILSVGVSPLLDGKLTGGLPFTVTANSSDNVAVATLSASFEGATFQVSGSSGSFNFVAPTPAELTSYDILITATDTSGLQTQTLHPVQVETSDTDPPLITFVSPQDNAVLISGSNFEVQFQTSDATLVETVTATFNGNQQSLTLTSGQQADTHTFSFNAPFHLTDTPYSIAVTATDISGNQASVTHNVVVTTEAAMNGMPKPVAYFTLDEADRSGKYVYDITRRHVGTNKNAVTNQTGQVGESFQVGSSKEIEVPHSEDLSLGGSPFTVSAWVNPTYYFPGDARFLEKTFSNDDPNNRLIFKYYSTTGRPNLWVRTFDGSSGQVIGDDPIPQNTWTHLVGVSDGLDLVLYVNGVEVKREAWPHYIGDTSAVLHIGASIGTTARNFPGYLDEIGVWPAALNADEIHFLYQFGANGITPDFEPPEEVTQVLVTTTSNQATLTWTPSANTAMDQSGYRIYQDDVLVADNLDPLATTWTANGLSAGTIYHWRITAFDSLNNETRGVELGSITLDANGAPHVVAKPISAWSLDLADIQGTQVIDSFGGSHGTLTGGTSGESGRIGEALHLGGLGNRIEIPNDSLRDDLQDGSYSLAIWYKPDEIPQNSSNSTKEAALVMKQGNNLGLSYDFEQNFTMSHYIGGTRIFTQSNYGFTPGIFHHIVATVDRDNEILKIYVDGALHGSAFIPTGGVTYNYGTQKWRIGEAASSGSYRWPAIGTLDEPKMWDRALSAEEIATLFQSENASLVWDFTPPSEAEDLEAVVGSNSAALSWVHGSDPGNDRVGYRLWIEDNPVPIEIPAADTSYTLTGLSPSSLFHITLTAYDFSQNQSTGARISIHTTALNGSLPSLPQPLAHWRLDSSDFNGGTVLDVVNGHNGNVMGTPVTTSAIMGEGLEFITDSDAVVIPNHADLEDVQENSYTLSAWFNPDNLPPNTNDANRHYGIFMKQGTNMGLYYTYEGTFRMAHRLGTLGIYIDSKPVSPNQFYHVAAVVDKSAGTVKIYLNGTLQETYSYDPASAVVQYGTQPWRLGEGGAAGHTYRWPAKGILDDAIMWNQALTHEQVTVLFQTTAVGQSPVFQKTAPAKPSTRPKTKPNTNSSPIEIPKPAPTEYKDKPAPVLEKRPKDPSEHTPEQDRKSHKAAAKLIPKESGPSGLELSEKRLFHHLNRARLLELPRAPFSFVPLGKHPLLATSAGFPTLPMVVGFSNPPSQNEVTRPGYQPFSNPETAYIPLPHVATPQGNSAGGGL